MTGRSNTIAAIAAMLHASADALLALAASDAANAAPEGYTSATYPHGPKAFRRHIARGMKATRPGKGYYVTRDDAEAYWQTLRRVPPPPKPHPAGDESEAAIRARLERAGIRLAAHAA